MIKSRLLLAISGAFVVFFGGSFSTSPNNAGLALEKFKPEEIVAKHLQSLGAPEALDLDRSRVITGTATVTLKAGGHGQLSGSARLVSQAQKNLIDMTFGALDYPFEKIGFDGSKLTVSQVRPGVRTIFGRYVLTNEGLFKEGLLGGVLSTAWPLLDLSKRNFKLQYDGIKSVNRRQVHQLKCRARNSDIGVNLHFDPETFQHVGTVYRQTLNPTVAANRPGESVDADDTRITITEAFSDFRAEGGLSLPHRYLLKLEIIGGRTTIFYEWSIDLVKFAFGDQVDANEFNVDADVKH
jgi:hypothetical protein